VREGNVFEELLKLSHQLDGMKISVPAEIPADDEGYIDRECPAPECLFSFKVFAEDWRNKVRDEEVFCPFCGHSADAQKWFTTEQVEHMKKQALAQVKDMLGDAMRRDADNWNRRQARNAFLKITMNVSRQPREVVLPAAATDPMRLKITCEACSCRFGVIGSAFFCPACGHNAADRVFQQSLGTIRGTLDALPLVRSSLPDPDTAENTVRLLLESGLQNAIMAFQRYAEALFSTQPSPQKIRRNVFQNLSEGGSLWRTAFGKGYDAPLQPAELTSLSRFFQQRHLLAHKEGLVDDDYVVKSGDKSYRTGQRLVVREDAVRRCLELIEKLAHGMNADRTESAHRSDAADDR
jgi:uncharacterized Zn finger protein (UPF0148 family)